MLALAAGLTAAVLPAADPKLQVVEMKLAPAAVAQPALKYQLLPDYLDLTPGDAVPMYLKATTREATNQQARDVFFKEVQGWLATPPAKLPVEAVKKALAPFDGVLHQVSIAARRTECRWDPPVREEPNPYAVILPELQEFRYLGRLLAVRVHLALAEHKYDAALRDLQTGYAMARQVGRMPFLVSSLVASAVVMQMNGELEAWVQMPGAPNLYWAIANLPQPIVDFRPGYDLERVAVYLALPQMQAQGAASQRNAVSQATVDRIVELAKGLGSDADLQKYNNSAELAKLAVKARAELIAHGHAAKQVEALTPIQTVALNAFEGYDEFRDELFKWLALPYVEAQAGVQQAEARLEAATKANSPRAALAGLLLPALGRTKFVEARVSRQLAALRTIEALRAYAAATGKLPTTLADIKDLPIPLNPVTGQAFPYRLENQTATLTADGPQDRERTEYRLRGN
jgi:hypothetical protein